MTGHVSMLEVAELCEGGAFGMAPTLNEVRAATDLAAASTRGTSSEAPMAANLQEEVSAAPFEAVDSTGDASNEAPTESEFWD